MTGHVLFGLGVGLILSSAVDAFQEWWLKRQK
jgi:hypothetical protein